ncbi:hypothetical protein O9992_01670 [Vibrio lentus]|nr:hypothetical protein [Vibrio lentus]
MKYSGYEVILSKTNTPNKIHAATPEDKLEQEQIDRHWVIQQLEKVFKADSKNPV